MPIFPNSYIFLLNWQDQGDLKVDVLIFHSKEKLERSSPIFKGRIWFTLEKGNYRPYKFEEIRGNHVNYHKAKDSLDMLKSAALIAIPLNDPPPNKKKFLELIKTFELVNPKMVNICPMCIRDHQKVTIIKNGEVYDFYGIDVCRICALYEIRDDFTKKGIELTTSLRSFLNKQLSNTKSVEKSVALLKSTYGIHDLDSENTLFDKIDPDFSFQPINLNKFFREELTDHEIHQDLIDYWGKIGVKQLLPVQQLALKQGLLKYKDMLVVAGTSSGKTFIGEMAGLNVFKNRNQKFVYLTPLVALTNQKYEQFKKRYRDFGARVSIRVGISKLNVGDEEKTFIDGNIEKSDIIVGTYEAFDWVLRSGKLAQLGSIGVVVIDEIQLLADADRGQELDGLMARIRLLFPSIQLICLSATIGNAQEIASDLNLKLVEYDKRPIPLERHLVITDSIIEKEKMISKLVKEDSREVSSTNFRGTSIVFTNSRKRAQELASILRSDRLRATYYHAGMTYYDRKQIEILFEKGKFDVITTTAALGAGVDFPVSQVIFEKPAMGARWLTVSEFYQMIGRAGRYGYHDLGKTYLIVTQGEKIFVGMDKSEEQVAFDLLTQQIEDIDLQIEFENEVDQVMAIISGKNPIDNNSLKKYYSSLYYNTNQLDSLLKSLIKLGLVVEKSGKYYITGLGRACAESFLKPTFGYQIAVKSLKQDILSIAVEMSPFTNIYLAPNAHAEIEQAAKAIISPRFLSDGVLETIFGSSASRGVWTSSIANKIKMWNEKFFDCRCLEVPYCEHPQMKISKAIIELRMQGLTPKSINTELGRQYYLFAYPGDLYSWLDQILHSIEAIRRLASAMKRTEIVSSTNVLKQHIATGSLKLPNKKPIKMKRKKISHKTGEK
jgi:archaea-specific helicase